jgi:outer membrane immunogenic protein
MRNLVLAAVTVAAALASPLAAPAAELPTKAPILKAPPPIAMVFGWSGHYVGGHLGGLWGSKDWSEPSFGSSSHDLSGVMGGFQAGFNYQAGSFVFGVQGDWSWTNADGSNNCVSVTVFTVTGTFECASDVKWLASVTGRVGHAMDRSLIYVRGGFAWERDHYSFDLVSPTALAVATAGGTRSGWTVGGGWETILAPNWTVFIEYNFYDFGGRNENFTSALVSDVVFPIRIEEQKHVVKVGVNYLFDWGGSLIPKN